MSLLVALAAAVLCASLAPAAATGAFHPLAAAHPFVQKFKEKAQAQQQPTPAPEVPLPTPTPAPQQVPTPTPTPSPNGAGCPSVVAVRPALLVCALRIAMRHRIASRVAKT